jgi:two-component system, sensor histidine kinase and response regulator
MPVTFDVDALKSELELDHEDVVELIDEFRTFLIESMEGLDAAITAEDFTKARSIAHSIKGSSGNLRVGQVFEITKTMQFKVDEGQEQELASMLPELKKEAQAFLTESENFS